MICDALLSHTLSFYSWGSIKIRGTPDRFLLPAHREGYGFCKQEEVDEWEAKLIEIGFHLLSVGEARDGLWCGDPQGYGGLFYRRRAFFSKHEADHLQIVAFTQPLVIDRTESFEVFVCKKGNDRYKLVIIFHREGEGECVVALYKQALVITGSKIGEQLVQVHEVELSCIGIVCQLLDIDVVGGTAVPEGLVEVCNGAVHQGSVLAFRDELAEILKHSDKEVFDGEVEIRIVVSAAIERELFRHYTRTGRK